MKRIKKIARKLEDKRLDYVYHNGHKNEANHLLRSIEREKGKTSPRFIKLSKEYATDVLGGEKYAPWLYVYSAVSGEFKEGWIPDNYYGKVVVPRQSGDYGYMSERKLLTDSLVKTNDSLDSYYYVNGLFWTPDFKVIKEKEIAKLLFADRSKVVYKIENSYQGKGIHFFDSSNFSVTAIKELGNGVFQKYVEQHPFFSEFAKRSVATIRMTSVCDDDGNIQVKTAYLRIGRDVDTHVRSASAIKVPLNIANGELFPSGYFTDWTSTAEHPDSNVAFRDKTVPSFQECLSEIAGMHSRIPFVRCIGWDIIVDRSNRVRLMEWNGAHNDIKFSEATQGPCFRDLGWERLAR